ncbi:MAG: sigma-70 family RNA polymerase sigma factor [Anaerolineae bacterium]|jgi:RNA polymerase sigma-70 factor, ECF subfamily
MVNDHDQSRLQRARSFDRQALAAIYDEYQQPIYRYIYRQVGDVEVARDLTADVFQRFLQAVQKGYGPEEQLKAWLYRVAHNKVIDYYRRRQHRQHLPLDERLAEGGESPAALAEKNISATQVREALVHLTPDQRQVITLKFLEGFSNVEVADILNKPIGAVKSLQHRALAALQRQLVIVQDQESA